MNAIEYKDWRLTGIAFELRLASNVKPNRTMASFVPGKKVRDLLSNIGAEKKWRLVHGERLLG